MRVLLTGASSFTGAWIAKALAAAGAEVTAICRGRPEQYEPARLARIEAVAEVAAVVFDRPFGSPGFLQLLRHALPFDVLCLHHAEVGDFRRPDYNPIEAVRADTVGLDPVLGALARRGLQRLVHTGTVFEAGEGDGDQPLAAIGRYGLAKTLTSTVVRHAAAEHGVPALKVTIPSPFGAGQGGGFVDYLLRSWCTGATPVLDHPDRVRDFVPVELLAEHYARLVMGVAAMPASGRSNPSGHVETVAAFAERLARAMRPRLGLPCRIEESRPAKSSPAGSTSEPERRFNTEKLPGLDDRRLEDDRFDRLADAARGRFDPSIAQTIAA
jgi:nucleoside-diphosphate-sugar epimerase